MKRIMILGASILQVPAITKAKEMGLEVIAVDADKHAVGFQYADTCLTISTNDIPRVVEAAKMYQIDGVMTLASDMPMRTVAAVSEALGVRGINADTALKATDKAIMRQCLAEHGVPVPRFYTVSTYEEYLEAVASFLVKFIVKPADNSGSRGVYLISDLSDKDAIMRAYTYSKEYSRSGHIVVEDYMEGKEVSVETLSLDGNVHVIQITDKMTTGAPHFVEMGHSQPTLHEPEVAERIRQVAVAAVQAIGIQNGPSHTEIMVTAEGPKIVELGARLGGDCITTHLVPMSTGIDMVECCIKIALGEKPDLRRKFDKGSAIRYFDSKAGIIKSIGGIEEARHVDGVQQVSFVKNVGDSVLNIKSSSDRIGFVIAQSDDADKAILACEKAKNQIEIEII